MKNWQSLVGIVSLTAVLNACGGGGGVVIPPSAANTIGGVVSDIGTGALMAGVSIKVVGGTQTTVTDANGEFLLDNLPAGAVNLSAEKTNFAPGYASAQSTNSSQTVFIRLKKEGALQNYNATQSKTISQTTEAGPYAVIFTPNSLETSDTNLRVSVTPLDPTKEVAALPGELSTTGATPTPLQPVTFAEFTILDSANKRVNLKANASAIVELPIPVGLRSQYPMGSKIHCYSYNPTTGKWEDFVEGTVSLSSIDGTTPVLKASVRHFSWYGGAPQVAQQHCRFIKIVRADGTPLEGAVVTARPGLSGVTDKDGFAHVTISAKGPIKFIASKTYTDSYLDDKGNIIPQKGSKVIEIGQEDDELTGLTDFSGPCPTTQSTPAQPETRATNDLTIKVGRPIRALYEANGFLSANVVFVSLESGAPDNKGNIVDGTPASGAKITLQDNNGQSIALKETIAGSGMYFATDFAPAAGKLYTLNIDADGNGTTDGTGACNAIGVISITSPANNATVAGNALNLTWTDTGTSTGSSYAPIYYVAVAPVGNSTNFAYYIGTDLGFLPRNTSVKPAVALAPGQYRATLSGFSGSFGSSLNGVQKITNNITGVGVRGMFSSLSSATAVNFTVQ